MLAVRERSLEKATEGSVTVKKILCPGDFSDNAKKTALVARGISSLFAA